MLDYVEGIVYNDDRVVVHGSVPIKLKSYDKDQLAETSQIEFKLIDRILASERLGRENP